MYSIFDPSEYIEEFFSFKKLLISQYKFSYELSSPVSLNAKPNKSSKIFPDISSNSFL